MLPISLCRTIVDRFNCSDCVQRGRVGHGVDIEKKDSYDLSISQTPGWEDVTRALIRRAFSPIRSYLHTYLHMLIGAVSPAVRSTPSGVLTTLTIENFPVLGEPRLDQLIVRYFRYGAFGVQKYHRGVGGYPHWHSEIYPEEHCEALHRLLAFQFYLNDVADGGETEFYYQKRKIAARAGRMVIFPAGFTHTHRGNVPESADKYIITSWVLFRRAEELY